MLLGGGALLLGGVPGEHLLPAVDDLGDDQPAREQDVEAGGLLAVPEEDLPVGEHPGFGNGGQPVQLVLGEPCEDLQPEQGGPQLGGAHVGSLHVVLPSARVRAASRSVTNRASAHTPATAAMKPTEVRCSPWMLVSIPASTAGTLIAR